MQTESARHAEAEKAQIAQQIEAERRATEKYKAQVQGALYFYKLCLICVCLHVSE